MGLIIPVRVQGHTHSAWEEMTSSDDTSFGGASFLLKHAVEIGNCLLLDLPLPKSFRRHAWTDPNYRIYALVRTVAHIEEGYRVGVMFFGKNPPRGYNEKPMMRFLLPQDPKPAPKDRRGRRRLDIHLNVKLVRDDGLGPGPQEEKTIAENLSKGGARVMTSLMVAKGEIITFEEQGGSFRTRAEIRALFIGKDNIPRANLKFLDEEAPDRLVPAD